MAPGGVKGFYRQKKKTSAELKPSVSAPKKRSGKTADGATHGAAGFATIGAGELSLTPALLVHGSFYDLQSEYGEDELKLREFDVDMRFGPCLGISRLQRWERAAKMGLGPPEEIGSILQLGEGGGNPLRECLWEGRV